jgi:NADP-reducing hydrogenase subunit HndA
MKKKLTQIAFSGTPEQLAKLNKLIDEHKNDKGAAMPILQGAQDIYGYLPVEIIKHIALALDLPYEELYGIATFYSQFSLNPKGKVAVAVCLGTACYVKGAGKLMDRLQEILHIEAGATSPDGKYSLEATRCIGACGLAPVLTVNNTVYGRLEAKDIDGIIAQYSKD